VGYTGTSGAVVYRQRTSSWSPLTTVDAGPVDQYPAISLDTGTGDVYAFWIASTYQIMSKKYSGGSWSTVTLETNTKTKYGLESIYNVSSAANMAWLWIQGPSGGDVKFSLLSSPFLSRTIDTDGSGFIFNYNYQRKIFYDGTYYWAFYGDGTNTVYTYSPDTYTWENTVINAFTTTGLDFVSVWYYDSGTTKTVYAVADSTTGHTYVNVRKGTISGTTITWGTEATVTVSATSFANKPAFITRDSNGYLWIASKSQPTSGNFNVAVVKSTNPDDVSAWGSLATIADTSSTTGSVYATILPLSGGNMYAVWYQDGSINGKKYTGSWGSQESVTTTANKVPSGVVDSSDNVHILYMDASGVEYAKRTSSWGAPTNLDSAAGSTSPTITIDTSTQNLYAYWSRAPTRSRGSDTPAPGPTSPDSMSRRSRRTLSRPHTHMSAPRWSCGRRVVVRKRSRSRRSLSSKTSSRRS